MAMSRDEILSRMVTGAAYIEREDITKAERERAWVRYNFLEEEFNRLKEEEKAIKAAVPEQVQTELEKIRGMLKPEKEGRRA